MKKRIAGVLLIVILVFANSKGLLYAKETPDELKNLYARSAVLMDADSGRILFGKNESEVLPMASTTKIMTCILALENMNDMQVGTVSEYAQKQPKVHLGVKVGEKYYIEDLLYSLMLESHNDSAVVIAETIGGSVDNFAEMMNKKAREIGCTDTYFITPNGLDAENETGIHATTAADLALIMSYCIEKSPEKEAFLEVTQTPNYQFKDIEGKRVFSCNNHNAFLGMMKEAISGKTGFTNGAGYCYVGAVRDGNRTFVVALLACGWPNNKNYKWKDTRKLMEYGLSNYEYQDVYVKEKTEKIYVKNGINPEEPLKNEVYVETVIRDLDSKIKLLLHKDEKVEVKIVQENHMNAPVKSGQIVGRVFYKLNGGIVGQKDIVARNSVSMKRLKIYMVWLINLYCV